MDKKKIIKIVSGTLLGLLLLSLVTVVVYDNFFKKEDTKTTNTTTQSSSSSSNSTSSVTDDYLEDIDLDNTQFDVKEILDEGKVDSVYGKWVNNKGEEIIFSAEGLYDYTVAADHSEKFVMQGKRDDGGIDGYIDEGQGYEGEYAHHGSLKNIVIYPAGVEGLGGDSSRDRIYYGPGILEEQYFYYLETSTE